MDKSLITTSINDINYPPYLNKYCCKEVVKIELFTFKHYSSF